MMKYRLREKILRELTFCMHKEGRRDNFKGSESSNDCSLFFATE